MDYVRTRLDVIFREEAVLIVRLLFHEAQTVRSTHADELAACGYHADQSESAHRQRVQTCVR